MPDKARMIETVFQRELFDPAWYRDTYPDVGMLGMEPDYHYRTYGHLMDRAPAAEFADDPHRFGALLLPPPVKGRELQRAHEIARDGDHDLGIGYARLHVPKELDYTIDTLHANAALARNDRDGWLRHLNSYIGHFGAAPVRLRDGEMLLDRFTTDGLPTVTGGPLISVIMPAWNAEKTVRAAANSILAQTWRNLELLIIDDASEDGTWGVMQEIAASDERVKVWRNKTNVGPYVSKNIVLSMAQGEWVTGHDADDWAHPQRMEHHIQAVLKKPTPPRASVASMLRLTPDGMFDRFTPISHFSLDGIAREAPISCLLNADFLRNDLGSWDCVRFGADSELMGRIVSAIGNEFVRARLITMLCISFENSLTNHPTLGVDRLTGPSQVRRDYSTAWREWHKALNSGGAASCKIDFPPVDSRPFPVPAEVHVPTNKIKRNYAALTGKDHVLDEAVTAICCSKRPGFLSHIASQLVAQTHSNLHIIYVAHGPGHDLKKIRECFSGVSSLQIVTLPDEKALLGDALNLALDQCKTDLVAKIDDDDFYGPEYIRSSIAALRYNGFDNVGIVGRTRAYCYVEDKDLLALRFHHKAPDRLQSRVFGGTIFWSRKAVEDQRFRSIPRAVDTAFFEDAETKNVKIFGCEAYDYIHIRYAKVEEHTWKIDSEDFLRPTIPVASGLRLDLAVSSPMRPTTVVLPGSNAQDSGRNLNESSQKNEDHQASVEGQESSVRGKVKLSVKPLQNIKNNEELVDISFRQGFVVLPIDTTPEWINHWSKSTIGNYRVIRSPNCKYREISTEKGKAIVLGEIFVCHGPRSLDDVLREIVSSDATELLDDLSGRFAVIIQRGDNIWIANDAFGSRTIFFSSDRASPGVSSHAALLAATLSKEDRADIINFMGDESYKRRGTVYLPGHATRFSDIFHVTPNSRYFINCNKLERYWPVDEIESTSVPEFLEVVNEFFSSFSKYLISEGKSVVFGLTGGLDARSVIAATRHYGVSSTLMTWTGNRLAHSEVPIVKEMIEYLNIPHIYVDPKGIVSSEGDKTFLSASNLASGGHRGPSSLSLAMAGLFSDNSCFIRGFGGEVIRGFYNRFGRTISRDMSRDNICQKLTDLYLTSKNRNCSAEFRKVSLNATDKFLSDTSLVSVPPRFDLLDLFYWEQRMGSWAANMHNEDDVAIHSMTGINSRKVFASSFGLKPDDRIGPNIMKNITYRYDQHLSNIGVVS